MGRCNIITTIEKNIRQTCGFISGFLIPTLLLSVCFHYLHNKFKIADKLQKIKHTNTLELAK